MPADRVTRVVELLTSGHPEDGLAQCRSDPTLAREVSLELARVVTDSVGGIIDMRGEPVPVGPPTGGWIVLQGPVVALAGVPGADRRALAEALGDAVRYQSVWQRRGANPLTEEAFALLLTDAREVVEAAAQGCRETQRQVVLPVGDQFAVLPAQPHGDGRLVHRLWVLAGREGAGWLGWLARHAPVKASSALSAMRMQPGAYRWRDEDWPGRIDEINRLSRNERDRLVTGCVYESPPANTAQAQVRLVCRHATGPTDEFLHRVAKNLAGYRKADPAGDVDLVDWGALVASPGIGVWVLELMGPAGYRERLVAAAIGAGRVTRGQAEPLLAAVERPAWADAPVAWQVAQQVTVGEVWLPDGRLAGGDVVWSGGQEGFAWVLDLPPGRYPVVVDIATHPLHGRDCATAQLVIDPAVTAARWEAVPGRPTSGGGYHVEVGAGSLGAVGAYDAGIVHESDEGYLAPHPAWGVIEDSTRGGIVYFTVTGQHAVCRTWVGYDNHGRLARVLTDLALLDPPERGGGPPGQ